MSMMVTLVRLPPGALAAARTAEALEAALRGDATLPGFDPARDVWAEGDWRDFEAMVGDEEAGHPFHALLAGEPLDGAEWTYGPPGLHPPGEVRRLLAALEEAEPDAAFPFDGPIAFLREAAARGMAVVAGVR